VCSGEIGRYIVCCDCGCDVFVQVCDCITKYNIVNMPYRGVFEISRVWSGKVEDISCGRCVCAECGCGITQCGYIVEVPRQIATAMYYASTGCVRLEYLRRNIEKIVKVYRVVDVDGQIKYVEVSVDEFIRRVDRVVRSRCVNV